MIIHCRVKNNLPIAFENIHLDLTFLCFCHGDRKMSMCFTIILSGKLSESNAYLCNRSPFFF